MTKRGLTLEISTFWKSCPDAEHFYGTVRDSEGKFLIDIPRSASRERVIDRARRWRSKARPGERLRVLPGTTHC